MRASLSRIGLALLKNRLQRALSSLPTYKKTATYELAVGPPLTLKLLVP